MTDEATPKLIEYKVSTRYKKSITEIEFLEKIDKTITYSTGWRWGYVTLLVPEGVDLAAELDAENNDEVNIDELEYDIFDRDLDDGCWDEWDYGDLGDEEIAAIEEAVEEEGYAYGALVDMLGWDAVDGTLVFSGPLDIENMGEHVPYVHVPSDEDDEDESEVVVATEAVEEDNSLEDEIDAWYEANPEEKAKLEEKHGMSYEEIRRG